VEERNDVDHGCFFHYVYVVNLKAGDPGPDGLQTADQVIIAYRT
jgi:hypothetical protein